MINFHPSEEQIRSFLTGDMSPTLALMIAAHIDMCPRCAECARDLNEEVADDALEHAFSDIMTLNPAVNSELAKMMSAITELPQSPRLERSAHTMVELELDGKRFKLPRSLQRYANKTQQWKKLVGKLWQAQVELGGDVRAEFIYMENGGSVPEHTHKGNEWTLVVNGEFGDGHHHYESGDLILLDHAHTHAPLTEDPDGCLVFSIVDQPLYFTSGIARLLNPFSQLFFKL